MSQFGERYGAPWTPEEDSILCDRKLSFADLDSLLPNRSRRAIEIRSSRLGLLRDKATRPAVTPWKANEVRKLLNAAARGYSDRDLAEMFPSRTPWQVRCKRYDLGIRRNCPPSEVACPLANGIRLKAYEKGITLSDLDKLAGTSTYFQRGREKRSIRHCVSAIHALGGRVAIQWEDPS